MSEGEIEGAPAVRVGRAERERLCPQAEQYQSEGKRGESPSSKGGRREVRPTSSMHGRNKVYRTVERVPIFMIHRSEEASFTGLLLFIQPSQLDG